MMPPLRLTVLRYIALALVVSTPLMAQGTSKSADSTPSKSPKPGADLITHTQLESRTFPNAYAAIEALHSNWLRARNLNPPPGSVINPGGVGTSGAAATGSSTQGSSVGQPPTSGMPRDASGIQVYLDGARVGGIETLKSIPIATIYSIRRISGTDAQARFGIGHSDGVLYVSSGPNKGGS